jgi:transposase
LRLLNLDAWLADIKAVERHVGRNATDPHLLVALWVFATLRGVGSARELERLCNNPLAYQWLCGGVSVNYHMLADFRSQGGEKWDALLTQIVAALMKEDLVTMDRVAQDGMRVRANAGSSYFRTAGRLEELLEHASAEALDNVRDGAGARTIPTGPSQGARGSSQLSAHTTPPLHRRHRKSLAQPQPVS